MAIHTYSPTNWQNAPDHKTTPLSAANLNNIETGITNAYSDIADTRTGIANVESGNTASRAYHEGELIYVSGSLYKAATDISLGDSFVVNTNIVATTVSESIASSGIVPHVIVRTNTALTVTLTKDGNTITAAETSSGVYEADVPEYGTYTITDGTATGTLNVKVVQIYDFGFVDGSTVTPTDDIETWLSCAYIYDTGYTTLADVLADSTTLSALISNNNAMDYLVRSTTWVSDICADSSAMSYIGLDNYASNTLLADSTWRTAICNSTYFESVLNLKVPTLSSSTSAVNAVSNVNTAYKVFDGSLSTTWTNYVSSSNIPKPAWVQYDFGKTVNVYLATFYPYYNQGLRVKAYSLDVSTDGTNFDSMASGSLTNTSSLATTGVTHIVNASGNVFRLNITTTWETSMVVEELQFYGREDV